MKIKKIDQFHKDWCIFFLTFILAMIFPVHINTAVMFIRHGLILFVLQQCDFCFRPIYSNREDDPFVWFALWALSPPYPPWLTQFCVIFHIKKISEEHDGFGSKPDSCLRVVMASNNLYQFNSFFFVYCLLNKGSSSLKISFRHNMIVAIF